MSLEELQGLSRKQVENGWVAVFNSIIAVVIGQFFFWMEYQHMAIIVTIAGVFIGIYGWFVSSYVNQIDQAMFLLQSKKEMERAW